jgi:hypothetical protein
MGADAFGGGGGPGIGPGMGDAMSVEAFSKAISKALGQTRTEQEREMDDAYYGGTIDQSQLDDPTDDSPAYDPDAVNRQVYGAPQNLEDPQGTQEGLDAEQEARDAIGRSQRSTQEQAMNEAVAIGAQRNISRQDQEEAIDKAYYDDRTIDRQKRENMKAIQDRFGFSPGNPHLDQNLDSPSREALAKDPNMRDPVFRDLAFEFIDNVLDQKTNSTLETIMGYVMKALNPAYGYGTAMKAMLEALGFNTNPNLGQRAIAAAITAFEGGIPGQRGAGGLMEGERGDSFGEKQAMEVLEKVAPWTKGLNQRQIEYYFADGNEEELEWVTNLYNQMNPE